MEERKRKQGFATWLSEGAMKTDSQRRDILNTLEQTLGYFVREKIDPDFGSLYSIGDPKEAHDLWQRITRDETLKQENAQRTPVTYTEVIHLYESYLRSGSGEGSEGSEGVDPAPDELLSEGELQELHLTKHERNPELRRRCIEIQGWRCRACGMDFTEIYGPLGKNYIEVHHLHPISQTDGRHKVDPAKDLVPLCGNCHAMIHRLKGEEMTVERLKELIADAKTKNS